jgi:hypothetical protein
MEEIEQQAAAAGNAQNWELLPAETLRFGRYPIG